MIAIQLGSGMLYFFARLEGLLAGFLDLVGAGLGSLQVDATVLGLLVLLRGCQQLAVGFGPRSSVKLPPIGSERLPAYKTPAEHGVNRLRAPLPGIQMSSSNARSRETVSGRRCFNRQSRYSREEKGGFFSDAR